MRSRNIFAVICACITLSANATSPPCQVEKVQLIKMDLKPPVWWVHREYVESPRCDAWQTEFWQWNEAGARDSYQQTLMPGG